MNGSWKTFLTTFNQMTGGFFLVFFIFFLKFAFDSNANDAVVNQKLDMIEDNLQGVVIAPVYSAERAVIDARISLLADKLAGANARIGLLEAAMRELE